MRLAGLICAAGLLAGPGVGVAAADAMQAVVLRGLDKTTARISTFTARLDEEVEFGSLVILARHCDKRPPEETPESAAFLEIDDRKPGQPPVRLFTGWMFASSPALNALEHPVYDLWVIDCTNEASASGGTSE
jgi:hypothetical protein